MNEKGYSCVILAVGHNEFQTLDLDVIKAAESFVYDVKSFLPSSSVDAKL